MNILEYTRISFTFARFGNLSPFYFPFLIVKSVIEGRCFKSVDTQYRWKLQIVTDLLCAFNQWKTTLYRCIKVQIETLFKKTCTRTVIHINKRELFYQFRYLLDTPHIYWTSTFKIVCSLLLYYVLNIITFNSKLIFFFSVTYLLEHPENEILVYIQTSSYTSSFSYIVGK